MESRSQGVRPLRRDEKQEPPNGRGTLIARIIPQERALTRTDAEPSASIEYPPPNDAAPHGQFPCAAPRAVEDAAANDDPERCDLLIAIGDEWSRSGDHANAQESLRDAALLAERIGDATRFAQAVIALPGWNLASPEPPNALARLLAERALVLGQHNPGLRAMLMARLAAEIPSSVGHEQRIAELDASALELARTAHDPRCELYVRCCRERLLRDPDYLAQRLLNAEEIFRLAVERGEYAACHLGAVAKCAALATAGQISEAHETARLADGIAAMSGLPLHAAGSLAYHAASAVMDGRFADAGEAFARCRTLADDKQILHLLDLCWPMMLAPLDEMGNLNEIESAAEQALQRHRVLRFTKLCCAGSRRGRAARMMRLFTCNASRPIASRRYRRIRKAWSAWPRWPMCAWISATPTAPRWFTSGSRRTPAWSVRSVPPRFSEALHCISEGLPWCWRELTKPSRIWKTRSQPTAVSEPGRGPPMRAMNLRALWVFAPHRGIVSVRWNCWHKSKRRRAD